MLFSKNRDSIVLSSLVWADCSIGWAMALFHPYFLKEASLFQSADKGIVEELPRVSVLGIWKFLLIDIVKLRAYGFRLDGEIHGPVRRKHIVGAIHGRRILDLDIFADGFFCHGRIFSR